MQREVVKYADRKPVEVIWSKHFEHMPEGFNDLYVYVPSVREIVRIAEGTGDNLLPEDTENGYVDYIYYEQYSLDADMPKTDGGQLMTYQLVRDKYKRLADCIPDVLDMAYGGEMDFRIL